MAVARLLGKGGFGSKLIRGGVGSVLLKIAAIGSSLGLAVVLARSLGPKGYGLYSYVYALISILAIPAQFGLPALVVRETAKAESENQWGRIRGLWRWANLAVAVLALSLICISAVLLWLFHEHFGMPEVATFAWGLVLIPLLSLGKLRGAALQGFRKVVQGQLPETLIRPIALIVLVASVGAAIGAGAMTASLAMALHVAAATIGFTIGAYLLRRSRPTPLRERPSPIYASRSWIASALPMAMVAGITVVNSRITIVILGVLSTKEDVGLFRVAAQGAVLVGFGYGAISLVLRPYFARSYARDDRRRLQKLALVGAVAGLALAVPALVVYLFFGSRLLGLVFGEAYASGYVALVIVSGAACLNAAFGTVGVLLNMTGHERDTLAGMSVGAVCNVVLSLVLIPLYGVTGAAIASAISIIAWNIILWRMVYRRLGIDSSVFNLPRVHSALRELLR